MPDSGRDLLTLSMIVKDEAKTVTRTLASAKPFIDRWVILDTGSTDGTPAVIRAALEGVPGDLREEPFVDACCVPGRAGAFAAPCTRSSSTRTGRRRPTGSPTS